MTDSDDPSRRSLPPFPEVGERPAPSLADLAQAEDEPPLASPDDVLPAPTMIEPAMAVTTQILDAGAPPDEADTLDPIASERLGLASGRAVAAAVTGVSDQADTLDPETSERLAALRAGTDVIRSRPRGAEAEPGAVVSPSSVVAAQHAGAPSAAASPSTAASPHAPPEAATAAGTAAPTPSSAPPASLEALVAEASAPGASTHPSAPPASASRRPSAGPAADPTPPASGSVWRVVDPGPPASDPPAEGAPSLLGSASSMTSARDLIDAHEHDTLGVGIPIVPRSSRLTSASGPRPSAPPASSSSLPPPAGRTPPAPPPVTDALAARTPLDRPGPLPSGTARVAPVRPASAASRPPEASPPAPQRAPEIPLAAPTLRDTIVTHAQDPRAADAAADASDTLGISTPPPARAAPPPRRTGSSAANTAIAWAAVALCGGLVLGGGCVACLGAGAGGLDQYEGSGGPKVAVVELTGPITDGTAIIRELRRYTTANDIVGIVVRVDSPGGAVAPSQEIFDAMRRASDAKPVVVSMGTVAASGGFWIAMAGDWIVASPGSITGSIGVISQVPDLRGLAELLHVDMKTYKSGPYKDAGNPFRRPQPGDEAVHMELISDVYEQFVETISTRRHIELDAVRRFADGRIFTGRRAHELGLVDELGGLYDAAHHALVLAEARRARAAEEAPEPIEDEPTLVYPRKSSGGLLRLLSEEAGAGAAAGAGRVIGRALDLGADTRIEAR